MKHQHCRKAGNVLMIVGLVVMVSSIIFSVLNQLPVSYTHLTLPTIYSV